MAAMRKLGAASATSVRRKTLCDITNLRRPLAAAAHEGQQDGLRCAEGVDGIARLVKENSDLVKLLEERDKFVELSEAELQNLRLAYWQLAQANSQMLAELNLRKTRLKSLQHVLTCTRAALKSPMVFLLLPQDTILLMRLLPHRSTSLIHTGGQEDITVQSMEQGYQEVNCESTCQLSEMMEPRNQPPQSMTTTLLEQPTTTWRPPTTRSS